MKTCIKIIACLMILIMVSNLISCENTSGLQSQPTSKTESLASPQVISETSKPDISGKGDLWGDRKLKVAYIGPGAAGNWYVALKKDLKNAANDWNIQLYNYDAAGKREKQEEYIIELVKKVDIIALTSTSWLGWDEEVFEAARRKDIPIIFIALSADIKNDLWTSYIVNDWYKQGEMAGEWLINYLEKEDRLNKEIKIVEISGTEGAGATIGRGQGFRETIKDYSNIEITISKEGHFTQTKGYEEIQEILSETTDINVVFCHDDEMAIGATDAIEEAGLVPGKDILIIGTEGTNAALEAIIEGKIACSVEDNPLMGDLFMEACVRLANGEEIEREIHPVDRVFDITNAQAELDAREENGYGY